MFLATSVLLKWVFLHVTCSDGNISCDFLLQLLLHAVVTALHKEFSGQTQTSCFTAPSTWGIWTSHQLVGVFGPGQVADLRAGVRALQRLTRQGVPETQTAVGGAAAWRQQPMLVRGPGDGLHCCQVVTVLLHWDQAGAVPHQQLQRRTERTSGVRKTRSFSSLSLFLRHLRTTSPHLVVVASRSKVLVVRRPFETAHFLPVTLEPPLSRGGSSDVPLQDHSVSTARRQLLPIPRQSAWATKDSRGFLHFTKKTTYHVYVRWWY